MTLSPKDRDAWLTRWREGRTGFHLDRVNPFLERNADRMLPAGGGRVLVPLCGKSLELRWLVARGHDVVGGELAEQAVEELYRDLGRTASISERGAFRSWKSDRLEILVGDIFALDSAATGAFHGIWDRAALIALRPDDRARYAPHILDFLCPGGQMLLCTIDYDQSKMDGPPFSVPACEVNAYFDNVLPLEKLEEKDVTDGNPRFGESGLSRVLEELWLVG